MLKILLRGPRGKRKNMIGPRRHSADYLQVIGGNKPHVQGNESGLLGVAKLKYESFVNKINDKNAEHKNPEKSAALDHARTAVSTGWPDNSILMIPGGGISSLVLALVTVMRRSPSPSPMALTQEDRTQR